MAGRSRIGGTKKTAFPKTLVTYPTTITFSVVLYYPKKIQKLYKSSDTPLELCWQYFFTENQQILLYMTFQHIISNSFKLFGVFKGFFNNGWNFSNVSKIGCCRYSWNKGIFKSFEKVVIWPNFVTLALLREKLS